MCQRRQNSVMDCDWYGESKFFGEHEPQHQAKADRHVGVAAEVEVDLERVGDHAVPGVDRVQRAGVEREVGDLAAGIGQQDLLGQAQR